MEEELKKSLSVSMETTPDLLPHLPELLVDLWALGSSIDQIIKIVGNLNLQPENTRVLDLGCGKGAVTITLAHKFSFKTFGIDACEDFLKIARKKAEEYKVANLCQFIFGDIREFVKKKCEFDVVIYASLGGVLGNFKQIIKNLRNTVRTNGYIIIDDGFFKGNKKLQRIGYEHYENHPKTIQQLNSFGDKIIKEESTDEFSRNINREYLKVIKKRSVEFIKRHPELEPRVREYIKNQEEECNIIQNHISGALWLIQKQ